MHSNPSCATRDVVVNLNSALIYIQGVHTVGARNFTVVKASFSRLEGALPLDRAVCLRGRSDRAVFGDAVTVLLRSSALDDMGPAVTVPRLCRLRVSTVPCLTPGTQVQAVVGASDPREFTCGPCVPGTYCVLPGLRKDCPAGRYGSSFGLDDSGCTGKGNERVGVDRNVVGTILCVCPPSINRTLLPGVLLPCWVQCQQCGTLWWARLVLPRGDRRPSSSSRGHGG